MRKTAKILTVLLIVVLMMTACSYIFPNKEEVKTVRVSPPAIMTAYTPDYSYIQMSYQLRQTSFLAETSSMDTKEEPVFYSEEEVAAISKTLAGECYDDKVEDKREVARVIVNRVSAGSFGDSVLEVVSAKGQFAGYWNQSRQISENDIQIAKEILTEWYMNDCEPLSEYLFFCAGPNRENVFRTTFN